MNNADPTGLDPDPYGAGCGGGYFSGYLGCGGYTGGLPNQAAFGYSWGACGSFAWVGSYQFNMPGCANPVSEAQMSYFAMVQTTFAVQSGTAVANGILGQNGGANPCAPMFNLPQGVTLSSLASHVAFQFSDLNDSDLYAQTFEPNEQGNFSPGQYTIIFNSGVGNPNLTGGAGGAANTLIHELLHVASILYPGSAPAGWNDNDGGDTPAEIQNQAQNQAIINQNCFPKGTP